MGEKVTTGRPAANASMHVSPPAFSTRTSAAAISDGISEVQPITVPSRRSSRAVLRPSSRPHTVIGWNRPAAAMAVTVEITSPTPHDPATTNTAGTSRSRLNARRAAQRSGRCVRNGSPTNGPGAEARPPERAAAAWAATGLTAMFRSTDG
jgi:hypothetical protein